MRVHKFNPRAVDFRRCAGRWGEACGALRDDEVHLRIATNNWFPKVTVEVTNCDGIHVATVKWCAENDGSWYSAWMTPHNAQSDSRRVERLDVWTPSELGDKMNSLLGRHLSNETLTMYGITSN